MSLASLLTGLAARRGETLTVTVSTGGTYNPATGAVSGATATAMSVRGVVSRGKAEMVDGTAVLPGDAVLMLPVQAALTVAPVPAHTTATIDGVLRRAVALETRRDGGAIAGYILLMRGAS